MADICMGLLAGDLKVKEKLTGRFADVLSWMFIATAAIKRFEDEGRKPEDKIFLDYSMAVAFQKIQDAFDGIFGNIYASSLPWIVREPIYWVFKGPIRWWSRLNFVGLAATDRLTHRVANALLTSEEHRERLTAGMYMPTKLTESLGRLEHAYAVCRKAEAVEKKVRAAVKAKQLKKKISLLIAGCFASRCDYAS